MNKKKSIIIKKIQEKMKASVVAEKTEIRHLVVYVENNQSEAAIDLANSIEEHLKGIIEVKISTEGKKDELVKELSTLKGLVEDIEKALITENEEELHADEIKLIKQMRIVEHLVGKK